MIGKLLSTTIKVVTLPIDAAAATMDILTGDDGSKESRTQNCEPFALLENIRDRVAEAAEDIDQ
jgi:hypothetical protein